MVKEVFGEAKPDSVTLWGVTIDSKGVPDARASVVLMKFLRARLVEFYFLPDANTEATHMMMLGNSMLRLRNRCLLIL